MRGYLAVMAIFAAIFAIEAFSCYRKYDYWQVCRGLGHGKTYCFFSVAASK